MTGGSYNNSFLQQKAIPNESLRFHIRTLKQYYNISNFDLYLDNCLAIWVLTHMSQRYNMQQLAFL